MKVILDGTPKEIADLVLEIQGRQEEFNFVPLQIAFNAVKKVDDIR